MKRGRNVESSAVTALVVERVERIERIHGCRKSGASRRRLCGTCVRDTAHRLYTSRTRYALFHTRDGRDVFQSERTERGKKKGDDVVVCCAGRRVRIRCAANRTTSGYALTFLWPLTERESEEPFVLRVPTLCVDSGCKLRESVAAFSFLRSRGRAGASVAEI